MDSFKLVSSVPIQPLRLNVDTYVHISSGLRVVFCPVSGPLCNATIVIATEAPNDAGLPHTLEHLVFMGSKQIPYKGYLDTLATRCITTGTNAWTDQTHTAYTVCTAGPEGMLSILPVYLDHIIHPSLSDSAFVTEVYHVDGSGKEQGVVFCEMQGRENSQADLKDAHLNKLMYPKSGYSKNSGGLTSEIAKLTNAEIQQYHAAMYRPSNTTVILSGEISPERVLEGLLKVDLSVPADIAALPRPWHTPCKPARKESRKTVPFPSQDADLGSVSLGWVGPPLSDLRTVVALDVLFRYLQETSASPLPQRFVECADPLASSVDYYFAEYAIINIGLAFQGVPVNRDADMGEDDEDADGDEEMDDADEMSDGEASEGSHDDDDGAESDEENHDLFVPGAIASRVRKLFNKLVQEGFPEGPDIMQKVVKRHRIKYLEDLEDGPSGEIEAAIIPDVIFGGPDCKLGSRAMFFDVLDELEQQPQSFWMSLLETWLIKNQMTELLMKPDMDLADKIAESDVQRREQRIKALGKKGLSKKAALVKQAVAHNTRPVPAEFSYPPIPSAATIPRMPCTSRVIQPSSLPFAIQMLQCNTVFYHVRAVIDLRPLPHELRVLLALFQELLLETDVQLPTGQVLGYKDVVAALNEECVHQEVGIGLSGDTFSSSFASDVLCLYFMSEVSHRANACKWFNLFTKHAMFPADRVTTVAKRMLRDLAERKRDGSEVVQALSTVSSSMPHKDISNDIALSLFTQDVFLRDLLASMQTNPDYIPSQLQRLQQFLLSNPQGIFVQIAHPVDMSESDALATFVESWQTYAGVPVSASQEFVQPQSFLLNWQFNVPPPPSSDRAIVCPIKGLDSAYVDISIPCRVSKGHPDFYPVLVLCDLLSATEGPLWNRIRGQGYAYGADLSLLAFDGQLSFSMYESTSPAKGIETMVQILKEFPSSSMLTEFALDTAKAQTLFKMHAKKASIPSVIKQSLRALFMGFKDLEAEAQVELQLDAVSREDLLRVYHSYFTGFIQSAQRIVCAVANPLTVTTLCTELQQSSLKLSLQQMTFVNLSELVYSTPTELAVAKGGST